MTAEENEALSRRGIEEVGNTGNLDLIDEVFAPDIVIHDPGSPGGETRGIEAAKQYRTMVRTAFPNLHLTIDDMMAERDRVMVRFTMRGTHRDVLHGIQPTGKRIVMTGIAIDRYVGGRKDWHHP
jgi:predicted ester cyclase